MTITVVVGGGATAAVVAADIIFTHLTLEVDNFFSFEINVII